MIDFDFQIPTKIFFGKNRENEVGKIIADYGFKKVLVHYGKNSVIKSGLLDKVINSLKEYKIDYVLQGGVEPNPKLAFVKESIALARKEQVLESTRKTIAINRGEKTTVDTNPQKVLEHENLISDSEYITLEHQQGENATHIKTAALKEELTNLHQTKQDTLIAGDGITIEGQTISATGGGETSSFKFYQQVDERGGFFVYEHIITSGRVTLTTFTFDGGSTQAEIVLTGELKEDLAPFLRNNISISNSALKLTYDGTNMKLINSAPSNEVFQQATFTFYGESGGGVSPE